ncbi:hypothetical protein CEXT_735861 [Caerostris extrusa]|uniref:Uncharacterized protein n=1 Tax=Caerostris extrusa TaxID=172846 RepID=A0AAV4XZV5_CAEEX|nr:hypothetical protein CEXT_735861 [Caerostris extrusa]
MSGDHINRKIFCLQRSEERKEKYSAKSRKMVWHKFQAQRNNRTRIMLCRLAQLIQPKIGDRCKLDVVVPVFANFIIMKIKCSSLLPRKLEDKKKFIEL